MRRKLPRSVTFTICARDAANFYASRTSTNQHKCHLSYSLTFVLSRGRQFKRAEDFGADSLGVAKALEPRRKSSKSIVPEIAGAHTGSDHQIIEHNLAGPHARCERFNRA